MQTKYHQSLVLQPSQQVFYDKYREYLLNNGLNKYNTLIPEDEAMYYVARLDYIELLSNPYFNTLKKQEIPA